MQINRLIILSFFKISLNNTQAGIGMFFVGE